MIFDTAVFFENLSRKLKFHYNRTITAGTLRTDRYTFLITSHSVLVRMKNISNKTCRENQNTHFVFSDFFFENRAVYKITWKNIVERGRPQMTIWRIRIACWVTKATNTHSEYVILIAFPLQQWLQERASTLRCTYSTVAVWISVLSALLNRRISNTRNRSTG